MSEPWTRVFVFVAALAVAAGCAPEADVSDVVLPLPQALLACAQPPAELQARLWVSGSSTPCALAVDVAANSTTGSCATRPGRVRTLTLDWFTQLGGFDLLLAQERSTVDLSKADSAQATFVVDDAKIVTTGCRDMTLDQVDGKDTVVLQANDVPVCDVDNSCAGGGLLCSNLDEVCNGGDAFDASVEPP